MDKGYYVEAYERFWDECIKRAKKELSESGTELSEDNISIGATEIFEETANAVQTAGYYIVYQQEDALKDWRTNTEGIDLKEKDKAVSKILEELYI